MRRLVAMVFCSTLAACATTRLPPVAGVEWRQRVSDLAQATGWQLDGRAAVAFGTQGWQATMDWRQQSDSSEVRLAGPFGVGALLLKRTPEGLSLNGAPPSDAVLSQLRDRLGFELPFDHLRFWLLGIPDPGAPFELKRNAQDRAAQLTQDGWSVDFDRYMPAAGDLLPAHLVVSRDTVRVRIVVDQWKWER